MQHICSSRPSLAPPPNSLLPLLRRTCRMGYGGTPLWLLQSLPCAGQENMWRGFCIICMCWWACIFFSRTVVLIQVLYNFMLIIIINGTLYWGNMFSSNLVIAHTESRPSRERASDPDEDKCYWQNFWAIIMPTPSLIRASATVLQSPSRSKDVLQRLICDF